MENFANNLVLKTEQFLTYRERKKYIKKEKNKLMNPVVSWLGALLWAACVVLLLNQYLFQAYRIPSPSMEDTLLVKDKLFVNKLVYGPELLPGLIKLPGYQDPKRSDIIVFENPEYESRGTLFDITQRMIFMLTLSLVDIDRGEDGNPAVHFLVKRGIAGDGEVVTFNKGDVYLKGLSDAAFIPEEQYKLESEIDFTSKRSIPEGYYTEADEVIRDGFLYKGGTNGYFIYTSPNYLVNNSPLFDKYESVKLIGKYRTQLNPSDIDAYKRFKMKDNGIYVPKGWLLPIGDNRDNSEDGRYFGPVRFKEILGRPSFKFWPPSRIGFIK